MRTAAIRRVDVARTFQKQVDYVEKSAASSNVQSEHQNNTFYWLRPASSIVYSVGCVSGTRK